MIPPAMPDATSLRSFHQFRGESAIESVPEWKQRHLFNKLQERKFLGDGTNDFFIFFRFDAASAVDHEASAFEQGDCRAQNIELLFPHPRKVLWD